jgi:hypothetical protein
VHIVHIPSVAFVHISRTFSSIYRITRYRPLHSCHIPLGILPCLRTIVAAKVPSLVQSFLSLPSRWRSSSKAIGHQTTLLLPMSSPISSTLHAHQSTDKRRSSWHTQIPRGMHQSQPLLPLLPHAFTIPTPITIKHFPRLQSPLMRRRRIERCRARLCY